MKSHFEIMEMDSGKIQFCALTEYDIEYVRSNYYQNHNVVTRFVTSRTIMYSW